LKTKKFVGFVLFFLMFIKIIFLLSISSTFCARHSECPEGLWQETGGYWSDWGEWVWTYI